MGVFDLSILVPMNVHWMPINGGLLDGGPDSLHEIQILVSRVGQVIWFERPKGVDVVARHRDGTLGDVMLETNGIDAQNSRVVARQFTAEGVTIFDRSWNLGMVQEPVFRAVAFNSGGGSAASAVQRSITDHHCLAGSDCLSEMQVIVINRGVLHSPVGGLRKRLKARVQGQMGFRRQSHGGSSHGSDNQSITRDGDQHTLKNKEGRGRIRTQVLVVLLLVEDRLGDPLVPLLGKSMFQNSIGGGITPPDPLRI